MKKYMVIEPFDKAQEPRSRNKVSRIKSKFNQFIIYTLSLILLTGCVPGSNVNLTQGSKGSIPGSGTPAGILGVQSQKVSAGKHMTRNAQPYTGPIELKFDTALLGDSYQGPRKIIPWKTASSGGFSTQAVPAGPIVFQEQFVRDKNPIKGEKRDFTVSDTSKVYTIHIQNGDAQGNNTVSSAVININGQDWIRPNDFKGKQTLEVQKDSILLNANNTMTIDVNGSPGSTMIVTVIEGGQAGTIRRKNGPLNEHPDQAAHNAGNDRNIFDPADPNSLADLLPSVPGNINKPEPETQDAYFSPNNTIPFPVATGQVMIKPSEPSASNLDILTQKYNATILNGPDASGFYLLIVDMTKVNLLDLESNIRAINSRITDPEYIINSVSFSNLESARSFALITDLLIDKDNILSSVGFNFGFENSEASSPSIRTKEHGGIGTGLPQIDASNSWWLNEETTKVTKAWNYSLGFDTISNKPVRIAVIDTGFSGLDNAIKPGGDMHNQVLIDEGRRVWTNFRVFPPAIQMKPWKEDGIDYLPAENGGGLPICDLNNCVIKPMEHGTSIVSLIVSQMNNGTGIAGVAPHAKVIPYKVGSGANVYLWEVQQALQDIANHSPFRFVDVINMSFAPGGGLPSWLFGWNSIAHDRGDTLFTAAMDNTLKTLNELGVVIVNAAGNGSWDASRGVFTDTYFPGRFITVGAIMDTDPNPQTGLRRWVDFGREDYDLYGSNWGNTVHIWAPGYQDLMLAVAYDAFTPGKPEPVGGTSAASPIVAGVVALMKAVKPELRARTSYLGQPSVLNLLQQHDRDVSYRDAERRLNPSFVPLNQISLSPCKSASINLPIRMGILGETYVDCGTSHPSKDVTLSMVDAENVMEALIPPAPIFKGFLRDRGTHFDLETLSGILRLSWGNLSNRSDVAGFFISDASSSSSDIYRPIIFENNAFVEVRGRDRGNMLFVSQITKIDPPPSSPTGLQSSNITSTGFTLSWNAVPNATRYKVLKNNTIITTNHTSTSINVTGLNPSTTYLINVIAVNDSGESSAASFTVTTKSSAPTLTSIEPNSINQFQAGSFLLRGQNLFLPAQVRINRAASITPYGQTSDGTSLQFDLSPNNLIPGTHDIQLQKDNFLSNAVKLTVIPVSGGGSSGGSGKKFTVDVWNVDDLARVYVNVNDIWLEIPVLEIPYDGEKFNFDITQYLNPGNNSVSFWLWNYSGGYTWGFILREDGAALWNSMAGLAGVVGANNNDQTRTNEWVFNHTENIYY